MVSVVQGHVTLVPTTFEWAEEIDVKRAAASQEKAQNILKDESSTDTDLRLAEARLKRALVRSGVAKNKSL